MAVRLWVTDELMGEGVLGLDAGKVTGDQWAMDAAQAALEDLDGVLAATSTGPWFKTLDDPVALYLAAMVAFINVDVDRAGEDPRALLEAITGPALDSQGRELVF
jgi:hypothetical protein